MKIISRAKKDSYRFIALKQFLWDGRTVKVGEEVTIKEAVDQLGLTQRHMVKPIDLVDGLIYITLRPFNLPGQVKKFETKAMELVSLKAEDALALMLQKMVLPRDNEQWRPYQMKLGAPKRDPRFSAQLAEADQHIFEKEFAKKKK
jgi:hypothetical protein